MMLFKISHYAGKGFLVIFPLFLFFSTIFCNHTRVNNLFHLSLSCMLLMLAGNPILRRQLFNDHRFNTGLLLIAIMLMYFCMSNIWSNHLRNLTSDITHSLYLLLFILMFRLTTLQGKKIRALAAISAGIAILVLLTFHFVDKKTLLTNRLQNGFFGTPDNVIDLAGYFGLGIFLCLIIIRNTHYRSLYLLVTILLIGILLTQSRGPLLALIVAFLLLFFFQPTIRSNHVLKVMPIITVLLLFMWFIDFRNIFLLRIETSYKQSFIRLGIWKHTLELVREKYYFGWGLQKELEFINSLGDLITTTHNLYLAALLKGGGVGLLLLLIVMAYCARMAKKQLIFHQGTEGALFIFSTGFYITQGMFIIGNPGVSWEMFWCPLAIVLTLPEQKTTQTQSDQTITHLRQ